MEKEFVSHELALALKELGYGWPCLAWYNLEENRVMGSGEYYNDGQYYEHVGLPLYQQAFRWFRENYGGYHGVANESFLFELTINGESIRVTSTPKQRRLLNSYEEFQTACLKEMIEVIKENI